jgi:hypothetical protein
MIETPDGSITRLRRIAVPTCVVAACLVVM